MVLRGAALVRGLRETLPQSRDHPFSFRVCGVRHALKTGAAQLELVTGVSGRTHVAASFLHTSCHLSHTSPESYFNQFSPTNPPESLISTISHDLAFTVSYLKLLSPFLRLVHPLAQGASRPFAEAAENVQAHTIQKPASSTIEDFTSQYLTDFDFRLLYSFYS